MTDTNRPTNFERAVEADDKAVLRFLLEVGVYAKLGTPRFEEIRTALANHTRRALAAALSAGPEPEYEWGYRSRYGGEFWGVPNEMTARALAKSAGHKLIRRTKAGPTEVVE